MPELRRDTAVFPPNTNKLIAEEASDVESSIDDDLTKMQKQKTKTFNDQFRRSQEVNNLNTSLLMKNQDVDVSKQIKKVKNKLKSSSEESKKDKYTTGKSSNEYKSPQTSALDKSILGKVDQKPNLA